MIILYYSFFNIYYFFLHHTLLLFYSFHVAASTRVGNNLGAGRPDCAKIAGYVSPSLALGKYCIVLYVTLRNVTLRDLSMYALTKWLFFTFYIIGYYEK